MCLNVKLALLDMLLQLSISLILCPVQLQHRLSHLIKSILQSGGIQCYLRSLENYRSHWPRGSLRAWWSLSAGVSRGSSISVRGSSIIRGSSSNRGSSSRISSSSRGPSIPIRISSSIGWPSILTQISSSFRGSLIPI